MIRHPSGFTAVSAAALLAAFAGAARAEPHRAAQICSLGSAGVGQPGTLICKNASTGATTQSIAIGNTVVGSGGTGGTLSRRAGAVLVTNVAGAAVLLRHGEGRLSAPLALQTGGEDSLSGALGERGAYVLTGKRLLFFPAGRSQPTSSQPLLAGDGSAAQVALAGGFAYVSEKNGSLEAFPLARDGNLAGRASAVAGVPAGVIVGITGLQDLVVAPVAHLASNPNQSTVPVASGEDVVQVVSTREVAACWAANHDGEVCITNPGSMTVSCGRFGPGGFRSYTSVAASVAGETILDVDMTRDSVGVLGVHGGRPVLVTFARSEDDGDFLTWTNEIALGTASATGALLLPAIE